MAVWNVWSEDQWQTWREWLCERPPVIREMAALYPPYILFKLNSTGQRVYIMAYHEDGTVTVTVDGKYNFVTHERNVFGIDPSDLTECDLPGPEDPVGNMNMPIDEVRRMMSYKDN